MHKYCRGNSYTLAGQRTAMRQGSAVYYLHGDHLGSTSLITNASGATLTETRYKPYGQPYWQWGATRTDYGFTGQRLDGFGLMDYNARYYSSTLGRFVSPDSIIPQPGSPLAWDRYSYVFFNPSNLIDPSGHEVCWEDGYCPKGKYSRSEHIRFLAKLYRIQFTGSWTEENQWAVVSGAQAVGDMYSMALGQGGATVTSALNFRRVHGLKEKQYFSFEWGCPDCEKFAYTTGTRHIQFAEMYNDLFKNTTLVFHELMHAFENAMEITLANGEKSKPARESLPDNLFDNRSGLQSSPKWRWQHSESLTRGEVFADMGIAWGYDVWDNDPLFVDNVHERQDWMNNYMGGFVNSAIDNQR